MFIFVLLVSTVKAQHFRITGKAINEQGKAVPQANILLTNVADSSLAKTEVSTQDGSFTIEDIQPGDYSFFISRKTDIVTGTLHITSDTSLGNMTLHPAGKELNESVVRAQRPLIEVAADKLVVNVAGSIINTGSTALEILAKSPGVRVDQNDNISLKGKQGVTIMIDGKISPLSGNDLATMLKNMPSQQIDKIEIISNPSARYDASGTAGIINIKTKKEKAAGLNGTITGGYAQGIYPKANGGINMNFRKGKWNITGAYSYSFRQGFNRLDLDRRFYNTNEELMYSYDQMNNAVFPFHNQNGSLGVDYTASSKTTVGLSVNRGRTNFNNRMDNSSSTKDQNDDVIYYFITTGRHHNIWENATMNSYLHHQFDTLGTELSIDVDYARYWSNTNQNFLTAYTLPSGTQFLPDYLLSTDMTGLTQIRSVKADYSMPVKTTKIDAGIKSSYVTADNEPLYYDMSNGTAMLDTSKSNHFIYSENINAAYLNLQHDFTKVSTQFGLRAEQTIAKGDQVITSQSFDRNYIQLFPSLAGQYHLNKDNDIGITLSRRIERPNYEQLNPFKFFIDKTTYRQGYPNLAPATTYAIELSHTWQQRFITTLGYSETKNVITQVIQPSDQQDSITVQTDKNLDVMKYFGLNGAYNFQPAKWWNAALNFNAYYAFYEGNVANTPLSNGRPTFDINLTNSISLPWSLNAELSCFYQARQLYAYMDVNPNWMLNIGLQKSFLNRKLNVRLNATDLFLHGNPSATVNFTGYQEKFVVRRESRQFTVSVSYRFGAKGNMQQRRRSGAEEEQRRVGNGAS